MKEKFIIGLFVIALFITFVNPVSDIDFPFHLKTGEYIYEHKTIPKDDPFTFHGKGVLTDKEIFILSQYWLAQVIFYKLYTIAGPAGVILLRTVVFSSFVFLLWFAHKKKGLYSSLLIATVATLALIPYALDRPQLFSFLFALVLILLLEKFRENPDSVTPLFFIPPLMLLWSNMHGGFIFGLAVIVIYTMTEAIKFFTKETKLSPLIGRSLSEKPILMLLTASIVAILFSYMNPNTDMALLRVIDQYTSSKWLFSTIREYMSPLEEARFPYVVKVSNISFWVLFGITCILIALNTIRKKSIDITTIAIIFFSSVAAFTAVRHIPLFIAMAIPLTRHYRFFKDTAFLKHQKMQLVMSVFLLILFIFAIGYGLRDYKNIFTMRVHTFYPEKAAQFLLDNQIDANMYNSNNKGSYLIWRLYPHYKVFQDTRHISLGAEVDGMIIQNAFSNPMQTINASLGSALSALVPEELGKIEIFTEDPVFSECGRPLWKRALEEYNIDLIVHEATSSYRGAIYPLTLRLLKDDEWVLIYIDGSVQIFIRNREKYSKIIERFEKPKELIYDEIILETIPKVRRKIPISKPYSSIALALTMKGKEDDAKTMIAAALELDKTDIVANFCEAYLTLRQERK